MPKIVVSVLALFIISSAIPLSLSHFKSSMVFLEPGIINKSSFPIWLLSVTNCISTSSKIDKASISVTFEICFNFITEIFILFEFLFNLKLLYFSVRLSSSSISMSA